MRQQPATWCASRRIKRGSGLGEGLVQDRLQRIGIRLIEGIGLIAVDIEHRDQCFRTIKNRQDQL